MFIETSFEARAARQPQARAIQTGSHSISYAELGVRVASLARSLALCGAGSGCRVGLLLARSADSVAMMLATPRTGAVLAPLDVLTPERELVRSIRNGRVGLLVSTAELVAARPAVRAALASLECGLVLLEEGALRAASAAALARASDRDPSADLPLYLFDLTREPLATNERLLQGRIDRWRTRLSLDEKDVLLHAAPLDQSGALCEVLGALLSGACLVAASAEEENPRGLRALIANHAVTVAALTPSTMADLLALDASSLTQQSGGDSSLRAVVTSGEPLRKALVAAFYERHSAKLHHVYAPPEALAEVAWHECVPRETRDPVPAGESTHLALYVMDKRGQPVPFGVVGEICLGGNELSLGARRVPFTAAALTFAEGPPSGSIVPTGDRGRIRDDGKLEVLGDGVRRVWHAGRRLDLSLCEQYLLRNPAVQTCAVRARSSTALTQEIVAYVVLRVTTSLSAIRSTVEAWLPPSARPSHYVLMTALPLTRTGEVDEQALSKFPVYDEELAGRWQEQLLATGTVEAAAVQLDSRETNDDAIHLDELIPARFAVPDVSRVATAMSRVEPAVAATISLAALEGNALQVGPEDPRTMQQALVETAARFPGKGILYLRQNGTRYFESYPSLLEKARRILAGLRVSGLSPRDRVILHIAALEDHFAAFWGCVLAGVTPVTVTTAPTYREKNGVLGKLYNTWKLIGDPAIITSSSLLPELESFSGLYSLGGLRTLIVERLLSEAPAETWEAASPQDVALCQLSSGSTGLPKCIQITHHSLVGHILGSRQLVGDGPDDIVLNWLARDHVVPMVMLHIKSLYLGSSQVQLPPEMIISEPLALLDKIEEHRASYTFMPNFGFKLVADKVAENPERRWDLSTMRVWLNAGEQVTFPVMQEFVARLSSSGVSERTIVPAYGMAEVATAVTYGTDFDLRRSTHRILAGSFSDTLQYADHDGPGVTSFVDVGGVLPGVQIRIADATGRVLPQRRIGRVQMRGAVVTPGYYRNDAANSESRLADGWFNSGDLGFVSDRKLVITGREKEMIIIRGANFFCYEIEEIISEVPGVLATFVAACALSDPLSGTERLAVFFVPSFGEQLTEQVSIIRAIQAKVTEQLGITPTPVIPLKKEQFPKTTSGKIQRTSLKEALVAGGFRELLRSIDLATGNQNTLPAWFSRRTWRPVRNRAASVVSERNPGAMVIVEMNPAVTVAFTSRLGEEMREKGHAVVVLKAGRAEDYERALATILASGRSVDGIFYLAEHEAELRDDVRESIARFQALVRGCARAWESEGDTRLFVISCSAQALSAAEPVDPRVAPLSAVLRTLTSELAGVVCRHVDLEGRNAAADVRRLMAEYEDSSDEPEVAYRGELRFACRLEPADLRREATQTGLKTDGHYLVTGGLGGIGAEISKLLLDQFGARLLILGRTANDSRTADGARVRDALQELTTLVDRAHSGGRFCYEALDVADGDRLEEAVLRFEQAAGRPIDGAFHLAGVAEESSWLSESPQRLDASLSAKVSGTLAVRRLMRSRPEASSVYFSSVYSLFGAFQLASYSAANRFVEAVAHNERREGRRAYSILWSPWDDLGMTRGLDTETSARRRGYTPVSRQRGLNTLIAALCRAPSELVVGLNDRHPNVSRLMPSKADCVQGLTAYVTGGRAAVHAEKIRELRVDDRFGQETRCRVVQLVDLPRLDDGSIDRDRLSALSATHSGTSSFVAPRDEVEAQVARIWQNVLGLERVGVTESFFRLGGHSLLGVRVMAQIQDTFGREIPLSALFQSPTIEAIARLLRQSAAPAWSPLVALQPQGGERPFFCVHAGGGMVFAYNELARALGDQQPFFGLQARGLHEGQAPHISIADMAAEYLVAVRKAQPKGPYRIGGWSFGGPIAFEMAQRLQAAEEQVEILMLMDPVAARYRGIAEDASDAEIIARLAHDAQIAIDEAKLRALGENQLEYLWAAAQASGLLPPAVGPEQARRFVPLFRANAGALRNYSPLPYAGRVALFRSERGSLPGADGTAGWQEFVAEPIRIRTVPGDHLSMMRAPHVVVLAEELRSAFREQQQRG